ncbi:type I phosphodiesterase/nucleotide pyrophosphatase [Microbacterium sp. AG1240]|uniref:alkaline phosphatase family protein n=1 Tax=Microbacterium sp. AG1240 TaxID=2183992 RepID=UPI000EB4DBA9|nr:nucleotide pyrophosphatase/phosphodiesterase family protein [Microbacterium sp. AG1240]RKT36959.1 type I phosphodiesterase/nucleotide pyrophosphatase [Microbacterium sp. AG1240]
MSLSLPADPPHARSLTGVATESIAALTGQSAWFAPARSVVICVVDGLGSLNLSARKGHARFLSSLTTKRDVARTVFPSTTAAALTSLLTGTPPGQHGIVGYRLRIPGTDVLPNQLKGWETDGLDPETWQREEPLMQRESRRGRPCFVVSRPEYVGTGFTEATLRGAEFVSAVDLAERVAIAADLAARHSGALVYLYAPDLDSVGHKLGWESEAWSATLETVDAAARRLAEALPADAGALVTADHGMVDVPRHRQLLFTADSPLVAGVAGIGGEPRMLHLYTAPGSASEVHAEWLASESSRSWVMTRDEAIDAGLFGPVAEAVRDRIGDVVVAARSAVAYYDDRLADKGAQKMVGQHGSLTAEERVVPLLRLGAFA